MSREKGPGDELGDQEILNATNKKQDGQKVKLQYSIPPTGRLFESEWIHVSNIKASMWTSWCGHVRNQINADYLNNKQEQDAGRKERAMQRQEARERGELPEQPTIIVDENGEGVGLEDREVPVVETAETPVVVNGEGRLDPTGEHMSLEQYALQTLDRLSTAIDDKRDQIVRLQEALETARSTLARLHQEHLKAEAAAEAMGILPSGEEDVDEPDDIPAD